ncbi:MAG: hypothetical protein J5977_09390 [Fibrobacter sp.]|nr:hypothetical protein [Fibrobacter sp.]
MLPIAVILFSIFPLTDTDIWWHLACAREWVTTWTPVRMPVVNVHEYFQLVVGFVYSLGGAPLLVAFKAILWGTVFALFGCRAWQSLVAVVLLFIFRYHFEIRPVLFSLLFLGIYWNILPRIFEDCRSDSRKGAVTASFECEACHCEPRRGAAISRCCFVALILAIQWLWCKFQGLYILGPLFALLVLFAKIWNSRKGGEKLSPKAVAWRVAFVLALFAMPFLHREGLNLFLYPFGLLDRLLGLTPSAAIFASEIAENRSPITLLLAGENVLESALMIVLCLVGIFFAIKRFVCRNSEFGVRNSELIWLMITAILALVAERNFVLFLPVLIGVLTTSSKQPKVATSSLIPRVPLPTVYCLLPTFFILGLWARSLSAYDFSMVAYQRVPVDAANWMQKHPHSGRLFNDDRAGGYLAFVNPDDSTYIDGRFILKTAEFFENYLAYAAYPERFLSDADSLNMDRAIFPLRYYARWETLLQSLEKDSRWHPVYRDEYFVVFDKH